MDHLTPQQRHKNMAAIHSKGTKPEMIVRRWLWSHGYRYRLNVKSVPGKPDIVMRRFRTAIFVNGCFWHGHLVALPQMYDGRCKMEDVIENSACCKIPTTNREFWVKKICRNMERDQENYRILRQNGWHTIVVWECQLKPKLLEHTMQQVERQLNQNFLSIYQRKSTIYTEPEEEYLMAAEED
ncbi:MAG: very short patch repair endonuclease [Bacteroidaceae bacterium]|nr:very short patch repair endonuclease [Bacteroidaceae bacterium]